MHRTLTRKIFCTLCVASLLFSGCNTSEDANSQFNIIGNKTSNLPIDTATPVDSDIYVEKNTAMTQDFITGMDVSSYLSLIESGTTFYDFEGNALTEQGFFDLLKQCGVNYIRVRVWNDPYDQDGNGYGGGNCDLDKAIRIGQYATTAGMKLQVDFHYSDFWADPGKQNAPKAWNNMTMEQKADSLRDYTAESLNALLDAGVDVGMVQLGNETTSTFCGESDWTNICTLLNAGAAAVRSVSKDILISIHMTHPEKPGNYMFLAETLQTQQVDYDIFASSYYPFWHGSTDNLTAVLGQVAEKYNKKVLVTETAWAYTLADGDGYTNTIKDAVNNYEPAYEFSLQGQAFAIAATTKAVTDIGDKGIGIFYWEPAWIPVQYAYDAQGNLDEAILASNQNQWESFGSGWASSYAADYDTSDAGIWYGGSAVDNQALFDFNGHPLETLKIFHFLRAGTTASKPISSTTAEADTPSADIDSTENLLAEPGFEEALSQWTVENFDTFDAETNAKSGTGCLHFYTETAGTEFHATQELTLNKGTYSYSAFLQGGSAIDDLFTIYITVGDKTYETVGTVTSWQIWQNLLIEDITVPEDNTVVTVGISVMNTTAGVWGSFDDCLLMKTGD